MLLRSLSANARDIDFAFFLVGFLGRLQHFFEFHVGMGLAKRFDVQIPCGFLVDFLGFGGGGSDGNGFHGEVFIVVCVVRTDYNKRDS